MKRVMGQTKIGYKTLRWLFNNYLHSGVFVEPYKHHHYYESNIEKIKKLQIGQFDIKNGLKKIPEYELYWVSPKGKIFTYLRGFFEEFKLSINNRNGYAYVNLFNRKNNKHESHRFHRLIAKMFIPNPENKPVVNHIDGNKLNNNVSNLEWATISENTQHAFDNGLAKNDIGEQDSQSFPIDLIKDDNSIIHYGSCGEAQRITGISKSTFLHLARSGKHSRDYDFKVKFSVKEKCNDYPRKRSRR